VRGLELQTKRRDLFATVRTEGALLPADFLTRISEGDRNVEGLTPEAYHLIPGEKINEAINRSWNRLLGAWTSFCSSMEKTTDNDPATSVTRERWLLPLFQELGYGRLQTSKAVEIDGKLYPISHTWQRTPIHLVGRRVSLDKPSAGVAGAARSSPHSLLQEFLNRSADHLWGFVSNGRQLRILRDNISFTRQAYVQFDLESMMDGEVYADFVILWLICHQSRVEAERPEQCFLEKWSKSAQEQGTRVLDQLRVGVEEAITALGRGFLGCPANTSLRENLKSGGLTTQDFYRQLLRTVYRLLFLFVAEDRDLLLDPQATSEAKDRYRRFYSITKLRRFAERRRGTKHVDIWRGATLIFCKLGDEHGCPELGLPPLDSFLWSDEAAPAIDGCDIENRYLLDAVRALTFTTDRNVRRAVDYRNLGTEELGSIYESLLELQPVLNGDAGSFGLTTTPGHERKTTGSYYTPATLINCLLDSALDPVLDKAVKAEKPETAILNLKICDPACGSGHFLIAAAHRVAKRLASVRTGDEEPSPESVRTALRDVIGKCVYGVDINPMAVELCKVSLWMEALEPGKPLSFLEHRIQCGNSLLGTTPALLKEGIPDEAFEPIEGDDAGFCREYKRLNRTEHEKQQSLFGLKSEPWERLGDLASGIMSLAEIDDATIEGIRLKQEYYEELVRSSGYLYGQLWADAWVASFVWKKAYDSGLSYPMTEEIFRKIEQSPYFVPGWIRDEIERLADQYCFFHWHLAFPDVFGIPSPNEEPENEHTGWSGGFDVVLGNPPWERIKLQEKEWFAERRPDIANAPNAAARRRMIDDLRTEDPELHKEFLESRRQAEGESHLIRNSGRYPLCGLGDVNTFAVFAELKRNLIKDTGRLGCIVPLGIATSDTTKFFFQSLTTSQCLVSLYGFENEEHIFPAIDHRNTFGLLTISGGKNGRAEADLFFYGRQTADLLDTFRHFSLSSEDIALINPNTKTCPVFRNNRDAEIIKEIYQKVPVLLGDGPPAKNPWSISFLRMIDMTNDSHLFRTRGQLEGNGWNLNGNVFTKAEDSYLPLHEAKMLHYFDHRFGTYEGQTEAQARQGKLPELNDEQHFDPTFPAMPRYWVKQQDVVDSVAQVPRPLIRAFRNNDEQNALQMLANWYVGDCLNKLEPLNSSFSFFPPGSSHLPWAENKKNRTANMKLAALLPLSEKDLEIFSQAATGIDCAGLLIERRTPRWLLGWRDITNATNERSAIFSCLPLVGVGNNAPLMVLPVDNAQEAHCLTSCLSSFPFDYVTRANLGGTHLNFFALKQLPVLSPETFGQQSPWDKTLSLSEWLRSRALELTYTVWDLAAFAEDLGYSGPPFRWDSERRFLMRCELDAAFFHLYGIRRDDVEYIMETFPTVKQRDERRHGEYRTKKMILEVYDAMAEAIRTGGQYQTILSPPPADPEVAHH